MVVKYKKDPTTGAMVKYKKDPTTGAVTADLVERGGGETVRTAVYECPCGSQGSTLFLSQANHSSLVGAQL